MIDNLLEHDGLIKRINKLETDNVALLEHLTMVCQAYHSAAVMFGSGHNDEMTNCKAGICQTFNTTIEGYKK